MKPFLIYGLPRSRTFWLSRFLSYGEYHCAHDQIVHVRSLADVRSWLAQDFTGTCETAAAPWWRLIHDIRPDIETVVIRRPVSEVVDSLLRLRLFGSDRDVLTRRMSQLDRRLDQIERFVPNVLSVRFSELSDESVCARVFEHCLPYQHDSKWWAMFSPVNLQTDVRAQLRYCAANAPQLKKALASCRSALCGVLGRSQKLPELGGMTFQEESFETFWRDGQMLFAEHASEVGPRDGVTLSLNVELAKKMDQIGAAQIITARCNGRMFGYVVSVIGPSLEDKSIIEATQLPFFVSRDARGIGPRLQNASIEALRRKGVQEVNLRAGVRGSGPKLASLYRRLGATEYGRLYNLQLEEAA